MKKWLAAAAIAAVVVAVVAAVLVYRVRSAEAAWARTFGPIDQVPEQFRAKSSNGKAADLALWAKRVTPQDTRTRTIVFDYLTGETASPSNRATPNPFVLQFQTAQVDAFATWIADEPPVFARIVRSPGTAVPNLLGIMQLQKTILAVAFARSAANDRAGAERLLDASWALNDALRHGPTMIEQLIAMAVDRYQLGVLRKADVDTAKWLPRIRSVDSLASVAKITQMEAWYSDLAVRGNLFASEKYLSNTRTMHAELADGVVTRSRFVQLLRTPVRWFDLPSVLEGNRSMIVAAATVRRYERIESDLQDAWTQGASSWASIPDRDIEGANVVGRGIFLRAVRTDAERELTEKVLLARTSKFDGSSAIAKAHWTFDGSTVQLSRPVNWGNLLGPAVPLRFDLR